MYVYLRSIKVDAMANGHALKITYCAAGMVGMLRSLSADAMPASDVIPAVRKLA
jgi:hypothetical protein